MTFEPIEHDRDDYGPDDAPARPSAGRAGALWRRFWRTLTGQRDVVPAAVLNAAYRERAHLVALLATWYPSHIGHTDPTAPDWAVVTVELATGQACWHISADDMDLFGHVQPTTRDARPWDGHSTEEKYRRIDQLAASVAAAKGDIIMSMRAEHWRAEREELRAARQAADDDTRTVRALTQAASRMLGMWAEADDDVRRELWTTLHNRADDVHDRYRERYAALDAKAGEQR